MNLFADDGAKLLINSLLALRNADECRAYLEDLLTAGEIVALSQRITVAKELKDGKNYNEIAGNTGASSATISRVNRCLNYGAGGYRTVLSRLEENNGG